MKEGGKGVSGSWLAKDGAGGGRLLLVGWVEKVGMEGGGTAMP